jgi:elongation factor 1-beta
MGEVAVTLKIMPESADVDLDQIEKEVRARVEARSIEQEPVAFGLKALRVLTVVPDAAGGTDEVEEKLAAIKGVGNVQVTDIRRLL